MSNTSLGIFQEFTKIAKEVPSQEAIIVKKEEGCLTLSYSELSQKAIKLGNLLYSKNVRKSDKVAVLLGNQPDFPISLLATQYIGAVSVPIDVKVLPETITYLLTHSKAKILICPSETALLIGKVIGDIKNLEILAIDSKECLDQWESQPSENLHENRDTKEDDLAALFYTSGTTGTPKAVMLSHKNLLSNVDSIKQYNTAKRDDVFLSILPLHHTFAFTGTCLLPLLLGAKISYPGRLSSKDLLNCIHHTKVTLLVGVPQLFMLFHKEISSKLKKLPLLARPLLGLTLEILWLIRKCLKINLAKILLSKLHQAFGKSVRFLLTGGAHLDSKVTCDFFKWGFTILEGYGLTETSPIATINPPSRQKIGSAGHPIPNVELKIVNPSKEGIGEVAIKGPNIMLGYYDMPDKTASVIKDGWFMSGDLGSLDKDGFLFLKGRRDEMITLSTGENIHPEEIENVYLSSPYIKEICLFASKGTGYFKEADKLVAVVVPDEDYFRKHKQLNIDDRIKWELDHLSHQLRDFQRIRGFLITRDRLPRTALGKVMRHKIQLEYSTKKPTVQKKGKEVLSEEDSLLLASEACQNVLRYFSKRFKRKTQLNDHLELDLGLDSLGRIELLLELQDILKLKIPDSEMESFFYVESIKDLFLKARPYLSEEAIPQEDVKVVWSDIVSKNPPDTILKKFNLNSPLVYKCITSISRIFLSILFKIFFRVEVKSKSNLPKNGPFIIYANHTSYLDGLILYSSLPSKLLNDTFFIGFRKYFMPSLPGGLIKMARIIPFDSALNMVDTLQACTYILKHSKGICYFPEGQRSHDGSIIGFKNGIGILTKHLDSPLVPVYIKGSFEAWPHYLKFPRFHKITITVGENFRYSDVVPKAKTEENNYDIVSETLRKKLIELSQKAE